MSNNTKRKLARFTSMVAVIAVLYWLRSRLQLWEVATVWAAFVAVYALSAYENKEPDADHP